MKIQAKLLVGFSAIVAMTALMGAFSVIETGRTSSLAVQLYDKPLMAIDSAHEALTSFIKLDRVLTRAAVSGIRAGDPATSKNIEELETSITTDLAIVQDRFPDSVGGPLLADIRLKFNSWNAVQSKIIAGATEPRQLDSSAMAPLLAEKDVLLKGIESQFDTLIEAAKAGGYESRVNAQDIGDLIFRIVLAAIVATVLGAGLVAALLARSITRPMGAMTNVVVRLADGDLDIQIPSEGRGDEIGEMARAIQVFKDNGLEMKRLEAETEVQRQAAEEVRRQNEHVMAAVEKQRAFVVASIATGLEQLSSGELTFRLTDEFAPEFRKLQDDFNSAMDKLQETMKVIAFGAVGIHSSTEEISQASDQLARRTEKQAASLEETAAALAQLTQTVRGSAEGAKQTKQAVAATKADAERAGSVVRSAVSAMGEIERSAHQISEIISVMDEIAFQTNLLALNAGIEAARAGETGKGFAVVALEVRALAQRSTVAAKEIKALISSSTQQVGAGVDLVGQTGQALERIVAQVGEINDTVGTIAAAAEEQSMGLLQVSSSVTQMDKITQQNAAMAEESTAAGHTLVQEANELARLINQFQLGTVSELSRRDATSGTSGGRRPKNDRTVADMGATNGVASTRIPTRISSKSIK